LTVESTKGKNEFAGTTREVLKGDNGEKPLPKGAPWWL